MAFFTIRLSISPSEYKNLTLVERESLLEALKTKV